MPIIYLPPRGPCNELQVGRPTHAVTVTSALSRQVLPDTGRGSGQGGDVFLT